MRHVSLALTISAPVGVMESKYLLINNYFGGMGIACVRSTIDRERSSLSEQSTMKRTFLTPVALAALWGSGADAAQITFGPSNQSITFIGNGANSVTVSSPTLT